MVYLMTIKLNKGDRLYKIIEAKTFNSERKRFISKIDNNGKITVLTYIFSEDDIKEDGTIEKENKRMMLLIEKVEREQFKDIIDINYKVYPQFQILWEKDYGDKSLEEAIELMNIDGLISTDAPIKDIIKEMNGKEGINRNVSI
jgi:hypothetical protein